MLKEGYSVKVHHQIKIKRWIFMNQGRKFMDQEQLCIPSSASDLLRQTAAVLFGCSLVCKSCDYDCTQGGSTVTSQIFTAC